MSGVIWKTPNGETGPEISRQRIGGEIVVSVLISQPAHMSDWHRRPEYHPLSALEEVPASETRYGGARGGRG